jgi:hypothetical protein
VITEEHTEPQLYRGPAGSGVTSHRRLLIAAGVSVTFLIGGIVLALSAGGGARKTAISPSLVASQSTTTTAPGAPAVETFQAFATKDPFSPLASDASPAGSPTTTTPGGTGAAAPAAPGGTHVALLDVFTDGDHAAARVRVNDTIFEKLAVGQTFAGNLKVISLSQSSDCGSFLYGDDQFRLCKGQEVVK